MRKVISSILVVVFLTIMLASCSGTDEELEVVYNIEETSMETAFLNDASLTSVEMTRVRNVDPIISMNQQMDKGIYYSLEEEIYLVTSTTPSMCMVRYEKDGDSYSKIPVTYNEYFLTLKPNGLVLSILKMLQFDTTKYTTDEDFYIFHSNSTILGANAYVRVNPDNFVDYIKLMVVKDEGEVLYEEYIFENHNEISISLPDATYIAPIEYTIKQIDTNIFTFTTISDTLIGYTNPEYSGEIDLENLTISFVKGSETILFDYDSDDYSTLRDNLSLLLGDDTSYYEVMKIITVQIQIDRGYYNDCLE